MKDDEANKAASRIKAFINLEVGAKTHPYVLIVYSQVADGEYVDGSSFALRSNIAKECVQEMLLNVLDRLSSV